MLKKQDTAAGFEPMLPSGAEVVSPARRTLRMDGMLDLLPLGEALQQHLAVRAAQANSLSSLQIEGVRVRPAELPSPAIGQIEVASLPERVRHAHVVRRALLDLHAVDDDELPAFSTNWLCELHRGLMEGMMRSSELGRLKTVPNGIIDGATGAFVFQATPPERTAAELESLWTWFQRNRWTGSPVSVAAVFFAELQSIHPFHDGDGRTGRVALAYALRHLGFRNIGLVPLDVRFWRTRSTYYRKLAATNRGRWPLFARYLGKQLRAAYQTTVRRARLAPALTDLPVGAARELLTWALDHSEGWFAHGDVELRSNPSRSALNRHLSLLTEMGLFEARGEARGRRYRLLL